MARVIEFQGTEHEFPDTFTDEQVAAALAQYRRDPLAGLERAPEPVNYARDLAPGLTRAVGKAATAVLPFVNPDVAERAGQAAGEAVVPQTNAGLWATGATIGGAGLAAKLGLSPLWSAATRIGSALGGAGTGAALTGEPVIEEMAKAGAGALIGEGLTAGGGALARGVTGAKQRIGDQVAGRVGGAIERATGVPASGATSEGLRDLGAIDLLKSGRDQKEMAVRAIEQVMQESTGPHVRIQPGGEAPGFFPGGARGVKAMEGGAVSSTPTVRVQGQDLTLREANDKLTRAGANAFSRDPANHTVNGVDQRKLYVEIEQEIEDGLQPFGLARAMWDKAQGAYKATLEYQRLLNRGGAFMPERDRLAPGAARTGSALQEILQGKGGATQIPAIIPRTVLPSAGAHLATEPGTMLNAGTLQAYAQSPAGMRVLTKKLGEAGYQDLMRQLFPGKLPYTMGPAGQTMVDLLSQDVVRTDPFGVMAPFMPRE